MASSLQLMQFDPAQAFRNDLASGTPARLVFYRAISINATDDDGMTMLSHAARVGDFEAVKILLQRGADPNVQDCKGLTPLMWLAKGPSHWWEHPDAVESTASALLLAGAKPNTRDTSGRTAAFIAVEQILYPFFKALAACRVRAAERLDSTGFTLLHALCSNLHRITNRPILEAIKNESNALSIARMLVENLGVDPNAKTAIGKTAREIAVANKSRLIAPWLVYGADAFLNDETSGIRLATGGATAHEAAAMRDIGKIRALIALGEARDEPASEGDQVGLTPLSCAASVVSVDILTALMDAGADPTARINTKTRDGRETDGTSAIRMLLWAPQSSTSIPSNLTANDWANALRTMLQTKEAANAPVDAEGLTPLLLLAQNIRRGWWAGEKKWFEVATPILLEKGADPNARISAKGIDLPFCKIPGSITVLGLLAMNGSQDAETMAQLLLQGGADPNLADKSGMTPLMAAAGLSSPSQAESFTDLLLNAGTNVSLKDEKGRTALDVASAAGNDGVVEKLLTAMTKPEAEHEQGALVHTQSASNEKTDECECTPIDKEGKAFLQTSPACLNTNATSSASSFFERIRNKHPMKNTGAETSAATIDAPFSEEQQLTHSPKSKSKTFLERVQNRSTSRQTAFSVVNTDTKERLSPLRTADPFGPVCGMIAFLTVILKPIRRSPLELRMMALGLFAEGGAEDPVILARRTADLLISLNVAVEVDWKTDGEDFCAMLEGLSNFTPIREAGFDNIPLDIQPDDDVPTFARKFDAVSQQWGWPIKLFSLELDADSYVFLLLDSLQIAPARNAAERTGLKLLPSSDLN